MQNKCSLQSTTQKSADVMLVMLTSPKF